MSCVTSVTCVCADMLRHVMTYIHIHYTVLPGVRAKTVPGEHSEGTRFPTIIHDSLQCYKASTSNFGWWVWLSKTNYGSCDAIVAFFRRLLA